MHGSKKTAGLGIQRVALTIAGELQDAHTQPKVFLVQQTYQKKQIMCF